MIWMSIQRDQIYLQMVLYIEAMNYSYVISRDDLTLIEDMIKEIEDLFKWIEDISKWFKEIFE